MNSTRLLLVAAASLLLVGCSVLQAAESTSEEVPLPAGTLAAAEVKVLFSDKTVTSVTAVKNRKSISYYAPAGDLRQLSDGVKRTGHWRVTDSGRMCLQMEELPEKCRIIVNEQGTYKKYIVKKNGQHEHSVTYEDFRAGNPLGL